MKNLFLLLAVTFGFQLQAQISLDHSYTGVGGVGLYLNKLQASGYKYTEVNTTTNLIKLYNLNHSLYKTITIPAVPGSKTIYYVTENLFDTDTLIEYVLVSQVTTPPSTLNPSPSTLQHLYVFKENGTQLFYQDSASFSGSTNFSNSSYITDNVFFDGTSTKMKISIQQGSMGGAIARSEIYNLPGSLPCIECSPSVATGIKTYSSKEVPTVFYPNPVTDQLKLKYELPGNYKTAEIRIQDAQGKLIEVYKITNTFDFIYVPSSYNGGLYLYSLVVDGEVIKTEKIIISK
jgi:hypothetical protein